MNRCSLLSRPLAGAVLLTSALLVAPTARAQEAAADAAAAKTPVALVKLAGAYQDLPETGADLVSLLAGGGDKPKSFFELLGKLEELGGDDQPEMVFVDLSKPVAFNLAQLAEVERGFAELRAAGKKTVAYLEGAELVNYQVATMCDRILLADMGPIDLPSLSLSNMFLRDALDLLGVRMDIVRVGEFKGAVEPFMNSRMSDHLRAHYLAMLKTMNDTVVDRIARARNMTHEQVRDLQAKRIFRPQEALEIGLVDGLVPWAGTSRAAEVAVGGDIDLVDVLKKEKKKPELNPFTLFSQLLSPKKKETKYAENSIAVLHLSGQIFDGDKDQPGAIVDGPTVKRIDDLAAAENVRGVVVRINSPGGSATASEAILLALKRLSAKKPVVCSMGELAASGGYYVTCFGRPIYAEAGTITGSIGVFGTKPNMGPLFRRLGVHFEHVTLDDSAAMMAMDRGWSDEEKARVQGFVDDIYERFTGHVAASRGMAVADVLPIAGGRVWSGVQAKERGLVDELGGLDAALAHVAKEAKIEDPEIVHLPKPRDFIEMLVEQMLEVRAGVPDRVLEDLAARFGGMPSTMAVLLDALRHDRPNVRVWAMLPGELRIR